jgi:methanogenic corrinoid protein MtbC1
MSPHDRFLGSLLEGDASGAFREAQSAFECGVVFLYEQVVRPALEAVGELWQDNRITVADEHLATAIAQSAVASLYPRFPWRVDGPLAIVCAVEGDWHEFGARMVADLLALDRWNARFLGGDVPTGDLVEMVRRDRPRLVGLSITLAERREVATRVVSALRDASAATRIVVGGRASDGPGVAGVDARAALASDAIERVRAWRT